ncbi:hypothetical protein FFJ24_005865 [Pedobacter sp. KBS0701]|uniref:hypothetical protein n=1 Tax=Pedobacter sp. KBS0701 TaxID=2578106 RepID=UPI00110DB4AF|nr:hypothetical protein [Pedobacter sp. KBS0701]QDW24372.1 hypothetical protein FFJ24_005865 [Pedobacter sp. KBS0701]
MRTSFTIFFLMFFIQTFAQRGKLFKGTLNNSVKISLYLQGLEDGTYADPILGAYKYDNQKDYILLNGYKNKDGNIVLVEQATVNFSGIFLGTLNKKQIKGKWIAANQKKAFLFDVIETTATKEQLIKFQGAIEVKANEFRNY